MAERHMTKAGRAATIASLEKSQALLAETLATGNVPVDEEVKIRTQFAQVLLEAAQQLRHASFVHTAVQHLETVLRREPETSLSYPIYLISLSKARFTEYLVTGSSNALDLSVKAGQQSFESAIASDLQERDFEAHLDIATNLGFALSRRHAVAGDLHDLDEAIVYTRMVYDGASNGSDRWLMGLNNLVSQLRRRIEQVHNDDLEQEAEGLLNELVANTKPGTFQRGIALGQLGFLNHKKFKQSGSLEDLEQAIDQCTAALDALPESHEVRVDILTVILDLFSARHARVQELKDMERVVHYSRLLVDALPIDHRARDSYLLEHGLRLKDYAAEVGLPEEVEKAIEDIRNLLPTMSMVSPQKEGCQQILSDLLGMRYALSTDTQDLLALTSQMLDLISERNRKVSHAGSTEHRLSEHWMRNLRSQIMVITEAPIDNEMRALVEQELAGIFMSYFEPRRSTGYTLLHLYQAYGTRLEVITTAIKEQVELSEEGVTQRMEELNMARQQSAKEERKQTKYNTKEYKNEFGYRNLAIDNETGEIIFEFNKDMIKEIMGYSDSESESEPMSMEKFIAREKRAEQRAFNKARLEGRHPNTNLCRVCREISRPLQQTQEGLRLTAKDSYMPFGNYGQLYSRRHCAVCRLIFSAITTETEELHPQLSAIDPEVQGTRLAYGTLSTEESVVKFDYGLKHVGELRLITSKTYRQAVRQVWEADSTSSLEDIIASPSGQVLLPDGQRINPALIKSWMNNCDHNHGTKCNPSRQMDGAEEMPMLFIDVIKECLVPATSREKYFALSYVWGQTEMFKTMENNHLDRRKPSALSDIPFPNTIKDAMRLVKSLGQRLLWVDALCMVQDDKEAMARDVPKMNIVYGQAFATIVALHGDSANAGLPGVSPGTRPPQTVERFRVSSDNMDLDYDYRSGAFETVYLTCTPRPLSMQLDIAKWHTRGWIFQERLLSRRCLYFSKDAVYFQCAQQTLSEYGIDEDYTSYVMNGTALKPKPASARAARDNPLDTMEDIQDTTGPHRLIPTFSAYADMVRSYTRREFSFKSDIIKGFAGVFATLEQYFQSKTYSGLPAAVFGHALLWTPAGRIPRRGMRLPTPTDLSMGKPDMQFPSWSWAGWDGPVEYQLLRSVGGKMQLPRLLLGECRVGDNIIGLGVVGDADIAQAHESTDENEIQSGPLSAKEMDRTTAEIRGHAVTNDSDVTADVKLSSTQSATSSEKDNKPIVGSFTDTIQGLGLSHVNLSGTCNSDNAKTLPIRGKQDEDVHKNEPDTLEDQNCGNVASSSKGKEPVRVNEANATNEQESQRAKSKKPAPPPKSIKVKVLPDRSRGTQWTVAPPQEQEPWDDPREETILSITAPMVPCSAFQISPEKEYLVVRPHIHQASNQAVRRIYDRQGNHCGLWWEQAGYGYVGLDLDSKAEERIHLVDVSMYGDVFHRWEGPARVEGEIRLFDAEAFPEVGADSGLVNIIAVDVNLENPESIGYRCTAAVIHSKAWEAAEPHERTIRLA